MYYYVTSIVPGISSLETEILTTLKCFFLTFLALPQNAYLKFLLRMQLPKFHVICNNITKNIIYIYIYSHAH